MRHRRDRRIDVRLPATVALVLAAMSAGAAQRPDSAVTAPFPGTTQHANPPRYSPEQLRRRPDYVLGKEVDRSFIWLAQGGYIGENIMTAADEQTTYVIVRRTSSSQPEAHARWDDIVIFRSGTGSVVLGDSLVGATLRAPGEIRGGTITKTFELVVGPGDIVRIPAAVPHQFVVAGPDALEYLVIKVRRARLPIRWSPLPEPRSSSQSPP
jgi:mannose-6-phosphate isomerase-like protein (cupin superfamily)